MGRKKCNKMWEIMGNVMGAGDFETRFGFEEMRRGEGATPGSYICDTFIILVTIGAYSYNSSTLMSLFLKTGSVKR
jgi:hypothetical protein